MAVSTTTRMGLTKYSSVLDDWSLDDFNGDADAVEARAIRGEAGTAAGRPAASAARARSFWHATDTDVLSYCDGTDWTDVPFGRPWVTATTGAGAPTLHNEGSSDVTATLGKTCTMRVQGGEVQASGQVLITALTSMGDAAGDLSIRFDLSAFPFLSAGAGPVTIVDAILLDTSASKFYRGTGILNPATGVCVFKYAGDAVTPVAPFAWAVNDGIIFELRAPAA